VRWQAAAASRSSQTTPTACPAAEDVGERLLRPLVHNDLMEEFQERMVSVITKFKGG